MGRGCALWAGLHNPLLEQRLPQSPEEGKGGVSKPDAVSTPAHTLRQREPCSLLQEIENKRSAVLLTSFHVLSLANVCVPSKSMYPLSCI